MNEYRGELTASVNAKGVIDVDTVKGCQDGMAAYPHRGCYSLCYAQRIAVMRGFNFKKSVVRQVKGVSQLREIVKAVKKSGLNFLRIGTMGDPSFNWDVTLSHASLFARSGLWVVVITKHWRTLTAKHLKALPTNLIINTSISPLDTASERAHRLAQYERLKARARSILRVVTADFDVSNTKGKAFRVIQEDLLGRDKVIDNPLRVTESYPLAKAGILRVRKAGGQSVSLHDDSVFLGKCQDCKELCGVGL